ncbi:MAG TPA: MBL fold metallo-hydrolase [Candidatus Scalindua sp.]|nr:MBL fold metallo-hydrolase [Candidatus Scalindua sp.]
MKIVFLGTNGWYDTKTGNTTCILIETKKEYIILDAGNGLYKIDRYIKAEKPIYLFLSHFHLDHIIGLHILNKFNFSQGIRIFGQLGTKNILKTIVNKPYTIPLAELPYNVEVYELFEGQHNIPFSIKCKVLLHSSKCFGYRFELQGRVITYCPDTGVCENVIELAKDADLLITECSFKSGQYNEKWPHLNPEDAAQIAKQASAKKLALLHFDANIYQRLQERKQAQKKARGIFSNTIVAVDDMEIEL